MHADELERVSWPRGACADPNAVYAELSGYADFLPHDAPDPKPPEEFPVILELADRRTLADLRRERPDLIVPEAYPDLARYATARPGRAAYLDLAATGWGGLVSRWELQLPVIPLRPAASHEGRRRQMRNHVTARFEQVAAEHHHIVGVVEIVDGQTVDALREEHPQPRGPFVEASL